MSDKPISDAAVKRLEIFGTEESGELSPLLKDPHSKNITLADWNELVHSSDRNFADVRRVYDVLKKTLPELENYTTEQVAAILTTIQAINTTLGQHQNGLTTLNTTFSKQVSDVNAKLSANSVADAEFKKETSSKFGAQNTRINDAFNDIAQLGAVDVAKISVEDTGNFGVYTLRITFNDGNSVSTEFDLPLEAVQLASVDDYVSEDGKRYLKIRFVDENIAPLDVELDEIFNIEVLKKQFIERLESEYEENVYVQDADGNISLRQVQYAAIKNAIVCRTSSGGINIRTPASGDVYSDTEAVNYKYLRDVMLPEALENAGGGVTIEQTTGKSETAVMSQKAVTDALSFPFADYGVPVVYFEGDITAMNKDNAVTLNYTYGERTGTCTLKWQGSSSLSYPKKNYTVKFDNAFEAVEGWGEQKKYCLKADWVDFSHCRNVVSAKLWGDVVRSRATSDLVTRLSALPNCGAIDGFPCFVVINGEWKGIYNFTIPKDGWMMGMGSGTKEAIICAEVNGGKGKLFEAEAVLGTDFDLEYSTDGWGENDIQESLNTLIRAVMNSDGTDIDTTIAQYLDIDSAIDYMIFAKLIDHQDGIGNNYILATYDGVKWFFSAYDMDVVFGGEYGGIFNSPTFDTFVRKHKLFDLLSARKREAVIDRYKELVKGVMAKSNVDLKFINYSRSIPLPAYIADAELLPNVMFSSSANNIDQVMNWYGERVKWCDEVWCAEMESNLGTRGLTYSGSNCAGMGTCREPNIKLGNFYAGVAIKGVASGAFEKNLLLESITLHKMVETVSKNAFRYCTYLKDVTFQSEKVFLGNEAFRGCTSLTKVTIPTLFDIASPMGAEIFNGCTNLARVVLPINIKTIPPYTFWNCTALKDIFYSGTMAEWEAVAKGTSWNLNTGAYTVHCTDGDVAKA